MTSLEKLQRETWVPSDRDKQWQKQLCPLTLARSPGNGGHCLPLLEKEHPSQGQPGGAITGGYLSSCLPQSEHTCEGDYVSLYCSGQSSEELARPRGVSNLGLPRACSQACGSALLPSA